MSTELNVGFSPLLC